MTDRTGTTPYRSSREWVARHRVKAWNGIALHAERKVRQAYDDLCELEARHR